MDGKRFDDLVRAFASSRRSLIRGVVGLAAAAGAGGLNSAAARCKRFGRPCGAPSDCCSGVCTTGICQCQAGTGPCVNRRGKTVCVAPCPPDQKLGRDCRCLCKVDGRPPRDGVCVCKDAGVDCTADAECCSGICDEYTGVCSGPI
jgi:hypothetical protein